jgi:hypothetical protein
MSTLVLKVTVDKLQSVSYQALTPYTHTKRQSSFVSLKGLKLRYGLFLNYYGVVSLSYIPILVHENVDLEFKWPRRANSYRRRREALCNLL